MLVVPSSRRHKNCVFCQFLDDLPPPNPAYITSLRISWAAYLQDKNIAALYASPLKRAIETADIITTVLRLPVIIMEQFRELNVGLLEGQPPSTHNWAIYAQVVNAWYTGRHDMAFPGGEDYVTLRNRTMNGLQEILSYQAGTCVALI